MKILGTTIDFDFSAPSDLVKYKQAMKTMEKEANEINFPDLDTKSPNYIDDYIDMLNKELQLFGNFLDGAFGDGVANSLLGKKPSLAVIANIQDALHEAAEQQGLDIGDRLGKYTPNRATRRSK